MYFKVFLCFIRELVVLLTLGSNCILYMNIRLPRNITVTACIDLHRHCCWLMKAIDRCISNHVTFSRLPVSDWGQMPRAGVRFEIGISVKISRYDFLVPRIGSKYTSNHRANCADLSLCLCAAPVGPALPLVQHSGPPYQAAAPRAAAAFTRPPPGQHRTLWLLPPLLSALRRL